MYNENFNIDYEVNRFVPISKILTTHSLRLFKNPEKKRKKISLGKMDFSYLIISFIYGRVEASNLYASAAFYS